MGLGKDGIMRFPRLAIARSKDEKTGKPMTHFEVIKRKVAAGIVPRGYNKLTSIQKKIARMIVNGTSVAYACKKYHVDPNTYYRWQNYHKLFQKYFANYAEQQSGMAAIQLTAKTPRAVRIVGESMESADPYFRYDAAHKHLIGMGVYRKHGEVKKDVRVHGGLSNTNTTINNGKPLDRELLELFVTAMSGKAIGAKEIRPNVIDVDTVKMLPGSSVSGSTAEVEEVEQAKAG